MYKVMQTLPVTDLRNNLYAIVTDLKDEPVVLTQNGHEAAVLVHPATWNKMVEIYEKWTQVQPPTTPRYLSWEEFEKQLQNAGFSLESIQKTIEEVVANRQAMRKDRSQVVSSKKMREIMAERGVHVGG